MPVDNNKNAMSPQTVDPSSTMLWFDLDDTIWDMWGNSILCLRELYVSHNLDRWFSTYDDWDEVYHRINRELWEQYGRGDITRDFLRSERFARPLRIGGADADEALRMAEELDLLYLESLGKKTALVPGAKEILEYLSRKGYRMGIVSNGFHEVQYNKLTSSGIDGYFDPVVLSDDAGINKPAPQFFDYAAERASSSALRNIVIGDNLQTDINGSLDYGWEAVWLTDKTADAGMCQDNPRLSVIYGLTDLKKLF